MELKVQRDTKVVLALTEEEAQALSAVCALTPRGVSLVADTVYDNLDDEGITPDFEDIKRLRKAMLEPLR